MVDEVVDVASDEEAVEASPDALSFLMLLIFVRKLSTDFHVL